MNTSKLNKCTNCNAKLMKHRPNLFCSICNTVKHFTCQGLSKSEASYIQDTYNRDWICRDCISDILPVNACSASKSKRVKGSSSPSTIGTKCNSCGGMSYDKNRISLCTWCDSLCHNKCINNSLGCTRCCEQIIPGYRANCYELIDAQHMKNDKIFNPYSSTHFTNIIGEQFEDNATWNEISNTLLECKYISPNNVKPVKSSELNVLSLNIRSLQRNIHVICDNVLEYQKYDVLCFNETNLNEDKLPNGLEDIMIEGFHAPITQSPARSSNRGGGLATYVNKRVCESDDVNVIDLKFETSPTDGEFLLIQISKCKNLKKSIIVGNVYRSPSRKPECFNELLDDVLNKIDRHRNKHILLTGDFNIDLIKYDDDTHGQALIETTTNKGFVQVISRPTRITDHSTTLIDHIYTNKIENTILSSVISVDLSDHLATYTVISIEGDAIPSPMHDSQDKCEFRMFNAANDEVFKQLINDEKWEVPDNLDAQEQYDHFFEIYNGHYNKAYPLKSKRSRRKNERPLPKPWILPWLEEACERKNRLYHEFVKSPTVENKTKYKRMQKFTEKHIKKAKNKYYNQYFVQYKDNSKKQWQIINGLLNRKKKRCDFISLHDERGNNSSNTVAEQFNEYFSNIASKLKGENNRECEFNEHEQVDNHMPNPVPNSMYIRKVEGSEVYNIIKDMKNKATLDTKVNPLKIANSDFKFTDALAKVISASFNEGIFPKQLKTARVIPIFKSGSKKDVSNYRPISLLDAFSKIYEKLMHNRVVDFLESNNSLHDLQYGFRSGRSCEHALLAAQNCILSSLNKQQISLLLLIDFSKAFDMVEHSILLKKLSCYGVRGVALKWFESYLSNREQFVDVNNSRSSTRPLKYGVPQGSILGPLLFVIYINDMPNISRLAQFILYADDANIIISGKTMYEVESQLVELSAALLKWVNINGLKLNLKKTNYMIFSKRKIENEPPVFIGNTKIEKKSEARFLGVIMDDKLTWARHIKSMRAKMSRYVGLMYRLRSSLPTKARLQIYHSFVQSHLNFCSLVWGFSAKSNIDSLFSSQKKGIRAAMPGQVNFFYKEGALPTHTKPFFSEHKILTVHGIIVTNALTFMYKIKKFPESIPKSVRDTISSDAPTHGSDHDSCHEWLKQYNNNSFQRSLFLKGPLIYVDENFCDLVANVSTSFKSFRKNAKAKLLETQMQGESDEWLAENFFINYISGLRKSKRITSRK